MKIVIENVNQRKLARKRYIAIGLEWGFQDTTHYRRAKIPALIIHWYFGFTVIQVKRKKFSE